MEDDEFSIEALEALNQESISLPSVADDKAYEVAGGNGLMLGLKLWWLSGMNNNSRTFSVNVRRLEVGQSLRSKWRVLKTLEDAGLIKRIHEPGKRLKVELLDTKREARGPP